METVTLTLPLWELTNNLTDAVASKLSRNINQFTVKHGIIKSYQNIQILNVEHRPNTKHICVNVNYNVNSQNIIVGTMIIMKVKSARDSGLFFVKKPLQVIVLKSSLKGYNFVEENKKTEEGKFLSKNNTIKAGDNITIEITQIRPANGKISAVAKIIE
jgi:ribosomal protein S8